MAKLIVLYKKPTDPKAFDDYYSSTHIPLAKKIPGLKRYEVSQGQVGSPAGASPYHLVATLEFASMTDLQKALGSAEGQAAAGDVPKFASGGVEMMVFDTREV
jgi:uncharacterized protein (TIGR02118 family)